VGSVAEIEQAMSALAYEAKGSIIVLPDAFLIANRDHFIALANRHQLPAIYPFRMFASNGGLVSYGPTFADLFRGAASYVDRILRGERPADLPVQAPTKFEVVINLKIAKMLDLTIPLRYVPISAVSSCGKLFVSVPRRFPRDETPRVGPHSSSNVLPIPAMNVRRRCCQEQLSLKTRQVVHYSADLQISLSS
jgi:hypothetical protein